MLATALRLLGKGGAALKRRSALLSTPPGSAAATFVLRSVFNK